jgi:hypothetical protein
LLIQEGNMGKKRKDEQAKAVRRIQSLIEQIERMHAATGGRAIRFDAPIAEQFDEQTCDALLEAMQERVSQ